MTDVDIGTDFFEQVEKLKEDALKVRWYCCVVVNLAAINYPDLIPQVWSHCWKHICEPFNHEKQFKVAQALRESLIKGCGIMGPAKVRMSSCLRWKYGLQHRLLTLMTSRRALLYGLYVVASPLT